MKERKWNIELGDDEADLVHRTLLWVAEKAHEQITESRSSVADFSMKHSRDRLRKLALKFDFGINVKS